MVAAEDGHEFFTASGSRYSVDLRPAFSLMDIAINSTLTLLQLRDVNLARAEDEVGREIVLRLPVAERNVATLVVGARTPSESGELLPGALTSNTESTLHLLSLTP